MIKFSHDVPIGKARSTAMRNKSARPLWVPVYKVVKITTTGSTIIGGQGVKRRVDHAVL
jgi:hypothetical protein